MRTPRTAVALTATALLLTAAPALGQQAADVEVVDLDFEPGEVTISAGGTVTWTQTGSLPHTVTADDGSFDSHPDCTGSSGCMQQGDTYAQTFDDPGEYPYFCRIHGAAGGVGMSGVVVVTAAGTTEEPTDGPTDDPTEGPADDGDGEGATVTGSIAVGDQSGDGTSVQVESVTISGADGFVVIHLDEDGGPGAVLGHVAVPEGTSTDVRVPLDQPITADTTVWPMLHVDAGVLGTYEFPGADGPVTADGSVVMAPLAFTLAEDTDDGGLPVTGAPLALFVGLALIALAGGGLAVRRTRAR